MCCRSGDGTEEETRSRGGLLLHCLPQQCRTSLPHTRNFHLHCLVLSGEGSSPGRSLYTHYVVLLSNLCVILLLVIVKSRCYYVLILQCGHGVLLLLCDNYTVQSQCVTVIVCNYTLQSRCVTVTVC